MLLKVWVMVSSVYSMEFHKDLQGLSLNLQKVHQRKDLEDLV